VPESPVKKHRSSSEWKELLKRQEQSGLSQREFCRRESVSLSSYSRHRRELLARSNAFVELRPSDIEPLPQSEPSSTVQGEPWSVEVALPNGCLLRFRG
jgi:hypothetical protein